MGNKFTDLWGLNPHIVFDALLTTFLSERKAMDEKRQYRHQGLTICTLGGVGHGKTMLAAGIIKVVSRIGSTQMDCRLTLKSQQPIHHSIGPQTYASHKAVDYETSGRHYTHIDGMSHGDNVKMLIGGSPGIRGAILVVSAVDGVTTEAEAEIRLASQVRIPTVVTFLNKAEKVKDPELIEICEMEIREILTNCGYVAGGIAYHRWRCGEGV